MDSKIWTSDRKQKTYKKIYVLIETFEERGANACVQKKKCFNLLWIAKKNKAHSSQGDGVSHECAPKDSFQDFDIVYIVEPCAEFLKQATWIAKFGQPLIMQRPKGNDLISHRTEDAGNIFNVI